MNLPIAFQNRMKELLKEEYDSYCAAMEEAPVKGIRINPLKLENKPISGLTLRPARYAANGWISELEQIGGTPEYLSGCIYSQEPSASFAVTAMGLSEGMRVLDLCAAPGSKSTQIAERLNHTGVLVANEIVTSRAQILKENLERHGVSNAIVTNSDPRDIASVFSSWFDAVLCDAPCSGEGMFRKNPQAAEEWSTEQVAACAARQAEILNSAAACVKPGGILLYSTCTFSLEENEGNVQKLLANHPDFELIAIDHPGGRPGYPLFEGAERCRRIYPMDEGEGHFVARFRRKDTDITARELPLLKSEPIPACVTSFLKEHLTTPYPYLYKKGDSIYGGTVPFYDIRPVRLVRHQVLLGTVRKDRFEPGHACVMSAYGSFKPAIELSLEELNRYRRGETLVKDSPNGWAAVTVNGHAIGLVKSDGHLLKNHYPKAFRIR